MSSYLQRHLRTHSANSAGDADSSAQAVQNGPAAQKLQIVPDIPTTFNVELCNQPSTLNSQTFFLVQVPQQNTPKFILVPSSQVLQPQQKVPIEANAPNFVTIQSNAQQRPAQSKILRKKPKGKTNSISSFASPNKNILIMPNTSQAVPNMQPLQIQTIPSFSRTQTLPVGQNIIVLQNVTEQSHLQLPTVHMNAVPSAPKTANIQIRQLPSAQDITIQSLPGAQEVSNIRIKAADVHGMQAASSSQSIANMHIHQELSNVHLQTTPNATHLSDLHMQALPEPQSVSSLQESQNLIVVQNSPGDELLSTTEGVENLQSMEEVQDVHFETLQTEDGLQNVLVLQNADGEQTRLCVQGMENLQGIQDVSNVQIQAMSNIAEPGTASPECQKVFIIQSSQGEQTLQVVDNFQSDPNVHVVENIQGLQAGQNQLQVLSGLQSHSTVQLPQNVQLRTVPAGHGLQTVDKIQGLQNIQTVGAGNQNIQTIQLVQKNSVQGLQHVLPYIRIVQAAPKVQLVHTF